MPNIEAYELNLEQRLAELKKGDPAYDLHAEAITEAIIFSSDNKGEPKDIHRILDAGCGLGFLTARLARDQGLIAALGGTQVVGIDPSSKAIDLAQKEHAGVKFYNSSAEKFPEVMASLGETPFDIALLNMVLHSIDDDESFGILKGVRDSLKPGGTLIITIPGTKWLMKKLVNYAIDQGMEKETGIHWVHEMLQHKQVDLYTKITGGEYYQKPLTIFNRSPEEYGEFLLANGFGVFFGPEGDEPTLLPYWEPRDYLNNYELYHRERSLLLSFALENSKVIHPSP